VIDLETVGIYSVGYTFGLVVILFTDAFIKAWNPWFFKSLSDPIDNHKRAVVKYTYLYVFCVFLLALGIAFMAKWILPFVVDERFYGAEEYIVWIALGYAVHGIYKIFFPYMVLINKTHLLAYSSVIAALVNLVLNYWWIKSVGAIGAAYATIAAFMVSTIIVIHFQRKFYKMPWILGKVNDREQ
jgi:O-antigen/teichoic acid export membrane protein